MEKRDHSRSVQAVFQSLDTGTLLLSARENTTVEFKESFNWLNKDQYGKSMASFANNRGGYLIFGVANSPRRLVGLSNDRFESLDEADIAAYLNGLFSPEIRYEKFVTEVAGKRIGVIYTEQALEKPVIAIKNDGGVKEAEIYYRYTARNDKIKYPELKSMFDATKQRERDSWMRLFERVSKTGPANIGVMDIARGTIEGENNALLIDSELIPKLKFIKEGQFLEKGKPTLKLVGDVRPVKLGAAKPVSTGVQITTDPSAPAVREETILDKYPLDYYGLMKILSTRYKNFKANAKFYDVKRQLMNNPKYSRERLLDPKNPDGTSKRFYSPDIIAQFDKHYKIKKRKSGKG